MSCWCVEHVVCEMHVAFSIYGQLSYTFPTEIESQLARDFHTHAPFLESVAFVALCCLQNRRRSPVHHCDGLGATSSATEFPCWIFCGVFDGTFNYANPNTAVRVIMMYDMGPEGPLFLSYKPDEFDRKLTIISPCLLDWLQGVYCYKFPLYSASPIYVTCYRIYFIKNSKAFLCFK